MHLHYIYYSATISSFRDFLRFTEVCHLSSDETRWSRLVVVVHLHTFNITVEATSIIEMNNSRNHIYFHDLPTAKICWKLCHTLHLKYPYSCAYQLHHILSLSLHYLFILEEAYTTMIIVHSTGEEVIVLCTSTIFSYLVNYIDGIHDIIGTMVRRVLHL